MKIKKLKLKKNSNNEYSDYYYFIPKNENIKCADGNSLESTIYNLKSKIETLTNKTNDLIKSAPLIGIAEGINLNIEDSAESRIKRFGIYGNSKQETRSGKNLLELMEGTYSKNGITAVIKDGVITLNGTATDLSFISVNLLKSFNLITGNTYHLSAFNTKTVGDSTDICALRLNQDGTKQASFDKINSNLAIAGNLLFSYITIRTAAGITYNNFIIKPQFEIGNGTDTWEQGGAMPSPDYPSEIKSAGDNINLFDKDSTNIENGYLNANGIVVSSVVYRVSDFIKIFNMEKITISGNYGGSEIICFYDNSKTFLSNANMGTNTTKTVEVPSEAYYVRATLHNTVLNSYKLEQGTKATPYSPYGQGCINEVICNDNLFDKNNLIPYTIIPRSNGVAITNNSSNYELYNATDFIPVKENTNYFINFTFVSTNYGWCFYDKNKNFISGIEPNVNSFATPKETAYLRFCYNKNKFDTNTIQLVEGSTEKPYVEHQSQTYTIPTQQPFRSIGETRDEFIHKDGKWYERHYVERAIFTGNENLRMPANNSDNAVFANLANTTVFNFKDDTIPQISNCFNWKGKGLGYADALSKGIGLYANNDTQYGYKYIYFVTSLKTASTVDEFKAILTDLYNSGNPLYIDYILQTPLDIECTEEQSQILNNLIQLQTYENITHIYSLDEVEPSIKVAYKKDINSIIKESGV